MASIAREATKRGALAGEPAKSPIASSVLVRINERERLMAITTTRAKRADRWRTMRAIVAAGLTVSLLQVMAPASSMAQVATPAKKQVQHRTTAKPTASPI